MRSLCNGAIAFFYSNITSTTCKIPLRSHVQSISRDTARLKLSVYPRYLSCRVPTQRLRKVFLLWAMELAIAFFNIKAGRVSLKYLSEAEIVCKTCAYPENITLWKILLPLLANSLNLGSR